MAPPPFTPWTLLLLAVERFSSEFESSSFFSYRFPLHQSLTVALVSLFLTDAGIRFKEVRYALDDTWPSTSEKLVKDGLTRSGKLPVLEYNGLVFSQVRRQSTLYILIEPRH